jgi:hypothetical protein
MGSSDEGKNEAGVHGSRHICPTGLSERVHIPGRSGSYDVGRYQK